MGYIEFKNRWWGESMEMCFLNKELACWQNTGGESEMGIFPLCHLLLL